ncbi:hypothetical protein CC2G_014590 [Coprinopsis cinerea AmutBmut pab1-1]|nr:hypothetical protein CC2G_014590 [Coprinopsis cinerea AmutBmut pab1-1]
MPHVRHSSVTIRGFVGERRVVQRCPAGGLFQLLFYTLAGLIAFLWIFLELLVVTVLGLKRHPCVVYSLAPRLWIEKTGLVRIIDKD